MGSQARRSFIAGTLPLHTLESVPTDEVSKRRDPRPGADKSAGDAVRKYIVALFWANAPDARDKTRRQPDCVRIERRPIGSVPRRGTTPGRSSCGGCYLWTSWSAPNATVGAIRARVGVEEVDRAPPLTAKGGEGTRGREGRLFRLSAVGGIVMREFRTCARSLVGCALVVCVISLGVPCVAQEPDPPTPPDVGHERGSLLAPSAWLALKLHQRVASTSRTSRPSDSDGRVSDGHS
jgi:hypothetical protein